MCLGLGFNIATAAIADLGETDLDKIAHDLLDVAPDIADLGEFGCFNLEKGRLGESGETARDFRLADAGGPDHQDILRLHFVAQLRRKLLPAPAVAQGDGDGALGVGLAYNETVELGDDFTRGKEVHADVMLSMTIWSLV